MTLNESKIVQFHRNMALWFALNSPGFNDYCIRMDIEMNVNDLCKQLYNDNLRERLSNINESEASEYVAFFKDRLFEEREFAPNSLYNGKRQANEWSDYYCNGLIEVPLLSHLIQQAKPEDLLIKNRINYKLDIILSYCDRVLLQQVLFNALLSLIFSAILSEKDSLKQTNCCHLLHETLKDKILGDYMDSYNLYILLERLNPDICRSFFNGFGIDKKEHDALTSFIRMGRCDDALREIFNLRNKDKLGLDSKLIEFCVEFQSAQKENNYLDWSRRFSIDKNELQPINTALIFGLKNNQLVSLDVIYDLVSGIYPELDIDKIKRPRKKKPRDGDIEKKKRVYNANMLYLPYSTKFVDKEKLIQVLIDKEWVKLPGGRYNPKSTEELYNRLNYFFRDGSSDDIELPCTPGEYILMWNKKPKGKFLHLLIRLLYNENPDAEATNVILKKTDGKNLAGINDEVVNFLDSREPIWPIVEKVFKVSTRDCKVRKGDRPDLIDDLQKLADDFFSCKKKISSTTK